MIKLDNAQLAALAKRSEYQIIGENIPRGGVYDGNLFSNNPIIPRNLGIDSFPRSSIYTYRPSGAVGAGANQIINREIPIGGKKIHLLNGFAPTDSFVLNTFSISPIISFRPIQTNGFDLDPDAHKMYGGHAIKVPKGFDKFYFTRYSEAAYKISGTGTINWLEHHTTPFVFLISEDLEYEMPQIPFDRVYRSGFSVLLSSVSTSVTLALTCHPMAQKISVNLQFTTLVNPLTYSIFQNPLVGQLADEVSVVPNVFPYSVTHELNPVIAATVQVLIAGGGVGETGACYITIMQEMGAI